MTSLKKKTATAFAWDLGGTFVRLGSGFVISIFLARLLEPAQFGLIGMAMVFIAISQVFIDVGFTSALIQNKENTNLTYSSVFYLNFFAGLVLTVLFYFLAPLIGAFYENPQITDLVRWLSLIFVFNSLNMVQQAILQRNLNFKVLTTRTVIANAVGGVVGVIAAFQDYGVYSLVAQQLTAALLGTVLLWSTSGWRPDLKFSFDEVKKLSGFSVYVFFDRFTSQIFRKLDTLFIAKVFSPATLGFYSRAETLNSQVTTYTSKSIRAVFFPVLSKFQNDDESFFRIYFKAVSFVCFLSFLISGLLFILAEPIVIGLFGEKWMPSVIIFQILIFKGFIPPLNVIMLNGLLSKGKSKENFMIGIFRKFVRSLPILIGLSFGFLEFVWAVVLVSYFLTVYNIYFLNKYLRINMKYHLKIVFQGVFPFSVIAFISNNYGETIYSKLLLSCGYTLFYLLYAYLIRMEGFVFVRKEIINIYKKI